ncbi:MULTISPECIES: hypothetical protein [unclassified Halobacteriovorax]|uniref:hypothetical protein n=1 Tax=unclassified Halobacteriovorax TaxID=2639665 RepID=UPI002FEF6D8B
MFKESNSGFSMQPMVSYFGIELNQNQYQKIKQKLDRLMDRCPVSSSYKLDFKKHQTNYIGQLTIQSYGKKFYAKKVAHTPYLTFKLLEDEIDDQLLKWKRERFSNSLAQNLSGPRVA